MQLLCQNVWVKIIQDFFDQCNSVGKTGMFWDMHTFCFGPSKCLYQVRLTVQLSSPPQDVTETNSTI